MAKEQFLDARLKIKRAYRHIDEVKACLVQEAQDTDSYRLSIQENPQAGGDVICLEIRKPLRPAYALCTGDAVHCLRTALDFAASDMYVRRTGKDPSRIHFPMHETRQNLVDALKKTPIKEAGTDVCDAIINIIKPYKTGNYPLWALNKLDNIDKHRLLVPVIHASGITGVNAEDDKGTKFNNCTFASFGSGLFRLVNVPGRLKITDHGQPAFEVFFNEGEFFENESVVPTLHQLSELTLGVIETLETYFFGD